MNQTAEGWSRYWAQGHAHSCPTSFDGFYGEHTRAFWVRQCSRLGAADTAVDLGCGNGALLRFMASQFNAETMPSLHGVDAAQVRVSLRGSGAPDQALAERLTVHAGTDLRALPLADQTISLIASQYAIEYVEDPAAWGEVVRVAAPRATVACVIHQAGSRLVQVARDERLVGEQALRDGGLFDMAERMLPLAARAGTTAGRAALMKDGQANAVRQAYNEVSRGLLEISATVPHGEDLAEEILKGVTAVLAGATAESVERDLERLHAIRLGVTDQVARSVHLQRAALGGEQLAAVEHRLSSAGFTSIRTADLSEDGHAMGWTLEATRGYDGQ